MDRIFGAYPKYIVHCNQKIDIQSQTKLALLHCNTNIVPGYQGESIPIDYGNAIDNIQDMEDMALYKNKIVIKEGEKIYSLSLLKKEPKNSYSIPPAWTSCGKGRIKKATKRFEIESKTCLDTDLSLKISHLDDDSIYCWNHDAIIIYRMHNLKETKDALISYVLYIRFCVDDRNYSEYLILNM